MPHWSCSSVLCYNNYQSEDASGNKIKMYKLPKDPETQAAYTRIFKSTEKFQWGTGYICAQHWSTGVRESPKHLPDLVLPPGHFELLKTKYDRAKKTMKAADKPTKVQRNAYTKAKKSLWQQKQYVLKRRSDRDQLPRRGKLHHVLLLSQHPLPPPSLLYL